jgi:hypothetical protein
MFAHFDSIFAGREVSVVLGALSDFSPECATAEIGPAIGIRAVITPNHPRGD